MPSIAWKKRLGTPCATSHRRRWRLRPNQISYSGLKDRHALTTQFLTISNGPKRDLEHSQIRLLYQDKSTLKLGVNQETAQDYLRGWKSIRSLVEAAAGRDGNSACPITSTSALRLGEPGRSLYRTRSSHGQWEKGLERWPSPTLMIGPGKTREADCP